MTLALILSLSALILALAAAFGAWWITSRNHGDAPTSKPSVVFTFDNAKAPGWTSTGNLSPRTASQTTDPTTGEDLPIASIIVHQGDMKKPSACFISYAYYDKSIDSLQALKEAETRATSGSNSLSLKKLRTHALSVPTPEGTKDYQLTQYETTGSYSEKLMRGIELGFVSLADGHIKIDGHCNTAKQLHDTIAPLNAISLISN